MARRVLPPIFVKQDIDGFFGLFVDNLVQLLVIVGLTKTLCGFTDELLFTRVLPAAAISIVFGNLFYAMQAWKVGWREGRRDVTALPYGINTPSVFAYIFFVMAPVYNEFAGEDSLGPVAAADLAWKMGLVACIGSGLVEFLGAFVARRVREATPRGALLAALAGIAIGFISMDFTLRVFEHPAIALFPMLLIVVQYFSGARLPLGMPAGLGALLAGTGLGWALWGISRWTGFETLPVWLRDSVTLEISSMPKTVEEIAAASEGFATLPGRLGELFSALISADPAAIARTARETMSLPASALAEIESFVRERGSLISRYMYVIVPMGLFNLLGSLQNIESAEAAGDKFGTGPSLAANGLGTLLAGALGSCFPTTIYIGHVGWKKLGARSGYSWLNAFAIAFLCLFGLIQTISVWIPIEAVVGILVWIAVVITAQAFQTVPREHHPAVALGLIPAIAAWGFLIFKFGMDAGGGPGTFAAATSVEDLRPEIHFGGLIALQSGFLLSSMCLAALGIKAIERRFVAASRWALALAVFSFFGVIHGWDPDAIGREYLIDVGAGWRYAVAYLMIAGVLYAMRGRAEPVSYGMDSPTGGGGPGGGGGESAAAALRMKLAREASALPAPQATAAASALPAAGAAPAAAEPFRPAPVPGAETRPLGTPARPLGGPRTAPAPAAPIPPDAAEGTTRMRVQPSLDAPRPEPVSHDAPTAPLPIPPSASSAKPSGDAGYEIVLGEPATAGPSAPMAASPAPVAPVAPAAASGPAPSPAPSSPSPAAVPSAPAPAAPAAPRPVAGSPGGVPSASAGPSPAGAGAAGTSPLARPSGPPGGSTPHPAAPVPPSAAPVAPAPAPAPAPVAPTRLTIERDDAEGGSPPPRPAPPAAGSPPGGIGVAPRPTVPPSGSTPAANPGATPASPAPAPGAGPAAPAGGKSFDGDATAFPLGRTSNPITRPAAPGAAPAAASPPRPVAAPPPAKPTAPPAAARPEPSPARPPLAPQAPPASAAPPVAPPPPPPSQAPPKPAPAPGANPETEFPLGRPAKPLLKPPAKPPDK